MDKSKVFDKESVMERLDDDVELLTELLQMLFSDVEDRLNSIKESIDASDYKGIEQKAHSLKSALGNLGANVAHSMAYEIEVAGREQKIEKLPKTFPKFKEAISEFKSVVQEYL